MKFLIVDDHEIVREGLEAFMRQCDAEIVVTHAENGAEALAQIDGAGPFDAVMLDLKMPGVDGAHLVGQIAQRQPGVPIVVLSSSEDPADVRRSLRAGARGYIPKSASRQTLWSALQFVLAGNVYVPPLALGADDDVEAADGMLAVAIGRLTARQVSVLRLLARGASNKEIARDLDLSEKTVKVHVTGIFKTLQVVNRGQARRAALYLDRLAVTEPPSPSVPNVH